MEIAATITGIEYKPLLCKELEEFQSGDLELALSKKAYFILNIDSKNKIALSWWVSAKRTRSYPYARVYNTLSFSGKKVTIIPIFKDEGKDGDRDFLQWDTISLMSLLGVYVIIAHYVKAEVNENYENKITNQRYDTDYIYSELMKIVSYQSDALHWNLKQIDNVGAIGQNAVNSYEQISNKLNVEMHSIKLARKRIEKLIEGKDVFMNMSREFAEKAQHRESMTDQPKESLDGTKGIVTIKNYLGGYYYFTADEVRIDGNDIYLVEGKHSSGGNLPSEDDIKDGLVKMILFANLVNVISNGVEYNPIAVLKLSTDKGYDFENLSTRQKELVTILKEEADINNFQINLS